MKYKCWYKPPKQQIRIQNTFPNKTFRNRQGCEYTVYLCSRKSCNRGWILTEVLRMNEIESSYSNTIRIVNVCKCMSAQTVSDFYGTPSCLTLYLNTLISCVQCWKSSFIEKRKQNSRKFLVGFGCFQNLHQSLIDGIIVQLAECLEKRYCRWSLVWETEFSTNTFWFGLS